MIKHSMAGWF